MDNLHLRKQLHDAVDDVLNRHTSEHKFISIELATPLDGQAVWVRHRNGAEYRLTYPFNHKDYPLWYPLPKE